MTGVPGGNGGTPLCPESSHPFATGNEAPALPLIDTHFHLEAASNMREVAENINAAGLGTLAVTVTPEGYEPTSDAARGIRTVLPGLGFHPWWVEGGERDAERLDLFELLAPQAHLIGEVGLDFGRKHEATRNAQLAAFSRIARICGELGDRIISLHAVRSAHALLDQLDRSGCTERCACVLHWFSGTSDEFTRARKLGCWFSVGEPMLATKKGREYARIAPADKLLLETDLPARWNAPFDIGEQHASLTRACARLAEIRATSPQEIARLIAENTEHLLAR